MILEVSTTYRPATDLGYLLHKNPARAQSFDLAFGRAHVVYPAATDELCTAVLLVDVDPVGLVRGPGARAGAVREYVNDRPYVASSFLSVALARVFGSALAGRSSERPELAQTPIPLVAKLGVVPCRGGESLLQRLFEPLGYGVTAHLHRLDERLEELGPSPYFTVELSATCRLSQLLTHLYVLVPVLDREKHYWIGDAEVDKLLRHGEGWLASHPERELIARRYLRYTGLVRRALAQLVEEDEPDFEEVEGERGRDERTLEDAIRLRDQRLGAVLAALRQSEARRVLDLGCGEGALLHVLLKDRAGLWEELRTNWICLDAELMPWSVKARELVRQQYAAVGVAARVGLGEAVAALERVAERGVESGGLLERYRERSSMAAAYAEAYRRYCWPVASVSDLRLAPFHLLASEGAVHVDKPHTWHLAALARLCRPDEPVLVATSFRVVDLTEAEEQAAAVRWWAEVTERGGEGMVVKPLEFVARGRRGLVQPALKCRGREYLRIIYGPEYTAPEHLERLRGRGLSVKRSLALREFALGIEALERFVREEPLYRVHECVFGVLALESEPVDPRL